jgi:hypothetical protein
VKQLGLLQWKQAQNKENKFGFHGSILAGIKLASGFCCPVLKIITARRMGGGANAGAQDATPLVTVTEQAKGVGLWVVKFLAGFSKPIKPVWFLRFSTKPIRFSFENRLVFNQNRTVVKQFSIDFFSLLIGFCQFSVPVFKSLVPGSKMQAHSVVLPKVRLFQSCGGMKWI